MLWLHNCSSFYILLEYDGTFLHLTAKPQRHTHMSFPNPTDQRTSNKNTEPCATESKSFACLHGCHGVQSVFRGRSSSLLLPQIPIDHNIIIIIAIEKRHRGEYAPPQMIVMMEMVVFLWVGGSASNLCCSYHFTVAVASIRPSVRPFSFGRVYMYSLTCSVIA